LGKAPIELVTDREVGVATIGPAPVAMITIPARHIGPDSYPVSRLKAIDSGPHLQNLPGDLMPDDPWRCHALVSTAQDTEVRASDLSRAKPDPQGSGDDRRNRHLTYFQFSGSQNFRGFHAFHAFTPVACRLSRRR